MTSIRGFSHHQRCVCCIRNFVRCRNSKKIFVLSSLMKCTAYCNGEEISERCMHFWRSCVLFFPLNIPFLTTLATLAPLVLRKVHLKLAIDTASSFYINLGNDCPNIAMCNSRDQ